ncbi:FimV/HubP family polar landmark protein [Rhodanobacter sp. C03]|uniref:FimV/HubP family polar landmark protein n=1 Tax=Rhodanobacter sp. C03 TaxID=1945858 RepID=UPI0009855DB8|nr:FimV/HubP family polar landmark protein [Rhodanobacter sp. C03]OOG56790.1 fimbrial protein FimV [Rhodanobacter sp. C03]
MNRSLKMSILMALALGGSQAMALDLGQIQVKSALGQPLLAEIPLHPANPAELKNLTVQLASSDEFTRAGIAGGRTAIPLHFSVANAGTDHPVIRITSSVAVDDPYLDLLIEVNGHAGKSVREFAILLDPPGAPTAAPASLPAPAVVAAPTHAAPSRSSHAATTAAAKPAPAASAAPAAVSNGQYGPVAHGQTLSSIARSTAPSGVDVQQMMLALKQANPDAFYHDNINALKSGAVLRVPTSAEAQAMTIAAAVAEVRRQNSDWRAGTPGKPSVVADAATRASASSAPGSTSASEGDRLALVPAKDVKGGGAQGSAEGKDDKATASLRQDLMRNQESLASLQQQSADLKTRLKDLTDINSKNEHLLSLKDSEIAELQNKLAAARKAAGMPAAALASAASTVKPAVSASVAAAPAVATSASAKLEAATAGTVASASTAPVAASSAEMKATPAVAASSAPASASTAAAAAPAAIKPEVKPAAKPTVSSNPTAVVEQPWYMQTWAWAAGAGAILLLLLLGLRGRKRKPAAAFAAKSAPSLADRFGTSPSGDQGLAHGDDIDQEELLDQLAEHPDDIGLHLELVTLYYSRRDVDHFEAAAEAMHAHITDPQQDEWQDVVHMGEDLVPGHPLFDHHVELPAHEDTDAHHPFDIDDYAAGSDATAAIPSMPPLPSQSPKKVSEYSFNFDLTHPAGVADSAAHQATASEHAPTVAPLMTDTHASGKHEAEPTSSWHFDDSANAHHVDDHGSDLGEFNDDPVDTKLDLARAYLDMGDADGARAMLSEVLKEGSQMQQDVAKRLLDSLH